MSTDPGLCGTCVHAQRMHSDRGSEFWRCALAQTDPRFSKYPRLPVLACPGYQPIPEKKPADGPIPPGSRST